MSRAIAGGSPAERARRSSRQNLAGARSLNNSAVTKRTLMTPSCPHTDAGVTLTRRPSIPTSADRQNQNFQNVRNRTLFFIWARILRSVSTLGIISPICTFSCDHFNEILSESSGKMESFIWFRLFHPIRRDNLIRGHNFSPIWFISTRTSWNLILISCVSPWFSFDSVYVQSPGRITENRQTFS
jgi:hypothetical protein